MVRNELVAKLRKHRGDVWLDVNNHNDGFWFKAVKSDVIAQLEAKFAADVETGFTLEDDGSFCKDYDVY